MTWEAKVRRYLEDHPNPPWWFYGALFLVVLIFCLFASRLDGGG